MLNAAHQGNGRFALERMRLPLVRHLGRFALLLRRRACRLRREVDIDLALALQVDNVAPSINPTIFEEQITSAQHWSLLQQGTAQGHIRGTRIDDIATCVRQTSAVEQRPQTFARP